MTLAHGVSRTEASPKPNVKPNVSKYTGHFTPEMPMEYPEVGVVRQSQDDLYSKMKNALGVE